MLELIINPKSAERKPWHMLFIGLLYGSLSMLLAYFIFAKDIVNSNYIGWIVVMFAVIFSMPFVYFTIKLEERKDESHMSEIWLLKEHGRALLAFLWLFVGFVIAFSFWHMVLPNGINLLNAQVGTFCQINNNDNLDKCLEQYGVTTANALTGQITSKDRFFAIFSNNIYVLIFTLILSLIMGAGVIFILAWNASVIAAAIGIFAKSQIHHIPAGLGRYLIHGLPEIAAYFIAALAGGILSIGLIRHGIKHEKFFDMIEDILLLILIAIGVLFIAALIEVFITPILF